MLLDSFFPIIIMKEVNYQKGVISMATANINVRVDENLKKEAEGLFNDLGLSMSSAITMFLKSAVRCVGIPFEVRRSPFNPETLHALAEYDEMKAHPERYKRYHSCSDLMKDVDNET